MTGERLKPPAEPPGINDQRTIAFSPDGRYLLATVYDGTAWLWNLADGGPAHILCGHVGCTSAGAFSPDSSKLATGDAEGNIRIWDTDTGRAVRQFKAVRNLGVDLGLALEEIPGLPLETVCFTPDGAAVVTAHEGGVVAAWDTATGDRLATVQEHQG